jgi:protein involved in polysaccharide export with SLBB domain
MQIKKFNKFCRFIWRIFTILPFSCIVFSQETVVSTTPNLNEKKNLVYLGDLVEVDVLGSTEFDWRGKLTPEGYLDGLDYVDEPVLAICRSEEEIAQEIAKSYSKFLRNPTVSVKILDTSQRPITTIYGAISRPQRFRIKRPIRLNELIILSGGFTDKVSSELQIFRPRGADCETIFEQPANDFFKINLRDLISGKEESNPYIRIGDLINVFEAESVYIIGGVTNPKQYFFREELTLSRAVSTAGGLTKTANAKDITIFRRENNETQIIEADLEKINGKISEDIKLRANDIIDVGENGKEKKKTLPVININEKREQNLSNLPLKIIE